MKTPTVSPTMTTEGHVAALANSFYENLTDGCLELNCTGCKSRSRIFGNDSESAKYKEAKWLKKRGWRYHGGPVCPSCCEKLK